MALRGQTVTAVESKDNIPSDFVLGQNYPNPFNPTTTIKYQLREDGFVTIKVFNVLGKEIATLVNREQSAGNQEVKFDGSKLASGIYFYRMQSGSFSQTKKLIMLK